MKEQLVREYISKINFKKDWNYEQVEEGMRKLLGERPFMDVNYVKDVMLNEVSGEAKEIKRIASVTLVFQETDNKFKKVIIPIDENL
jgi:hydrogenase maturation factor HypE